MSSQETDLVRNAYAAMGRGDIPGFFAMMSADMDWYESEGLPFGGRYQGAAAVAEGVFGPLFADFPDFTATPEEFLGEGSTVATVVRYRGTANRTQTQLDQPAVHVWDVHDGKLVKFRQFLDTVKYREVAGAPS